MHIILGKNGERDVKLDINVLLKTRLLIQANSGGGKSWLIRCLAEQLFGKVPTLIIDPEGEFATLREKFGFVLVGKGGETPADCRSAEMVAHKLLELRASAVCDLYELKPHERHRWVKVFLEALVNAPKNLWRPTVVVIDEAHVFCPEGKAGESEASGAVVDLAARGRKRRFCAVLATQRLGKLRKDASAELLNRLVGPTFEDVDLHRAADLLSIPSKENHAFFAQMRVLEPGFFFALGRAICTERMLIQIGPVETSHDIEDAKFGSEPPPLPENIKSLLPKLADLPKAAEEKARTEAELRKEISDLRRQLKAAPAPVVAKAEIKEVPAIKQDVLDKLSGFQTNLAQLAAHIGELCTGLKSSISLAVQAGQRKVAHAGAVQRAARVAGHRIPAVIDTGDSKIFTNGGPLPIGERKILEACIHYPGGLERSQLTVLSGYKRSSRDAYVARLREKGFVTLDVDRVMATPEGIAALPNAAPLPEGEELQQLWRGRLPQGERAIFEVLLQAYPEAVDREKLTEATAYQRSSRDAYVARLRAKELLTEPGRGMVRAADQLFG